MKIHLPNSAFLGNIDPFLQAFDPAQPERLDITANDKWISVHPAVLSMTAALGLKVGKEGVHCPPLEAASAHYLVRMGLLSLLGVPSETAVTEHESAGRFIPLTRIRTSEELKHFITEMIPLLHLEPEQSLTLGYVVSELVRNVLEHAQAEHGAVLCAQYYKKSNSIRIGIADTGLGVKATINRAHPADTDLAALRLALMPGITGATAREGGTEQNAGAGLFFIKAIAAVNRDFMVLYSGSGMFKLLKKPAGRRPRLAADPFDDRHSASDSLPSFPGTVVGVDITLDRTAEFSSLLEAIRETYGSAVRERRRERFRRPRFE